MAGIPKPPQVKQWEQEEMLAKWEQERKERVAAIEEEERILLQSPYYGQFSATLGQRRSALLGLAGSDSGLAAQMAAAGVRAVSQTEMEARMSRQYALMAQARPKEGE